MLRGNKAMQYIPDNLREFESAAKDVPDKLREIQRLLGGKWNLAALQRYRINSNWIAGLEFGDRHFRLVCDRGYIDVYEITGDGERQILPPAEQRTSIAPKQIYELLAKAVA
jgi:hypothetical protein